MWIEGDRFAFPASVRVLKADEPPPSVTNVDALARFTCYFYAFINPISQWEEPNPLHWAWPATSKSPQWPWIDPGDRNWVGVSGYCIPDYALTSVGKRCIRKLKTEKTPPYVVYPPHPDGCISDHGSDDDE
jgi:hypothetical protein